MRALEAFSPQKVSSGEFAGLDNLAAAEKYLKRVGRSTLDEMAEAIWEGGAALQLTFMPKGRSTMMTKPRHGSSGASNKRSEDT